MKRSDAIELIRRDLTIGSQTWCDLGCGSGTFTLALAGLLAPGSLIYAVDRDQQQLSGIPTVHRGIEIRKVAADMSRDKLPLARFDGVLAANALHFIKGQEALLKRIIESSPRLLIVEYDSRLPSPWGPYPLNFVKFEEIALRVGYREAVRLRTYPSRFGGTMYSALAGR